jgi:hypothetical protein
MLRDTHLVVATGRRFSIQPSYFRKDVEQRTPLKIGAAL